MTDWMNSGELIDWNRQANVNAGAYTGKYGNAPDPDIDGDAYFGGVSRYPYLRPVFNSAFQFNADGSPVLRDATQYEKRYWAMLTEYLFIIQQIFPLLLGQTM